ncbi:hypothetical protein FRC02_002466 [Tulasnella sp. 418]|nr:hypothetical protein FRC02_002466 [Tulasnella sp. 418]
MRLIYFLLLDILYLGVFGAMTTVSYDDADASVFTYLPPFGWHNSSAGWATPDTSRLYHETWHDATRRANDPPVNVTFKFEGVGVSVYALLWNPSSLGDADTNLTFTIDGAAVGSFQRRAVITNPPVFTYGINVFNRVLDEDGPHTLVINLDPSSLLLLDRIDVVQNAPNSNTVTSTQSSVQSSGSTQSHTLSTGQTSSSPVQTETISDKKSNNLPVIIGGTAGGAIAIILIVLGAILLWRRRKSHRLPTASSRSGSATYLSGFMRMEQKDPLLSESSLWESDSHGFEFLAKERVCSLSEIGVNSHWIATLSKQTIVFTKADRPKPDGSVVSKAVMFNIPNRSVHELSYTLKESNHYVVAHVLSPGGNIFVRWQKGGANATGYIIEAADARTNKPIRRLTTQSHCEIPDIHASKWINKNTIYIPDSGRKTITRWSITPSHHEPTIIQPLPSITHHQFIRFHVTPDEKWWVINGWTPKRQGGGDGLIEIRNVRSNQSRVVPGIACCIAEVEVYDVKKALLVVADLSADMLVLRVDQLDANAPGEAFKPVYKSVDLLDTGDFPEAVMVFQHLPIVAVSTVKGALYFFELHFGDYLFSRRVSPDEVWPGSVDEQSLLMHAVKKGYVERIYVNTQDLIGYVRQVLKNDMLASGIAVRTGLPGAEDVVLDDMLREYKDVP